MITDRDACMATYTKGLTLGAMAVGQAMSNGASVCRMNDDVESALSTMAEKQLHRLPVVDQGQKLAGMLSMADVIQAVGARDVATRRRYAEEILGVMAAVTRPRQERPAQKPAKRVQIPVGA
jgi:CBS domain-containing protein